MELDAKMLPFLKIGILRIIGCGWLQMNVFFLLCLLIFGEHGLLARSFFLGAFLRNALLLLVVKIGEGS